MATLAIRPPVLDHTRSFSSDPPQWIPRGTAPDRWVCFGPDHRSALRRDWVANGWIPAPHTFPAD